MSEPNCASQGHDGCGIGDEVCNVSDEGKNAFLQTIKAVDVSMCFDWSIKDTTRRPQS